MSEPYLRSTSTRAVDMHAEQLAIFGGPERPSGYVAFSKSAVLRPVNQ